MPRNDWPNQLSSCKVVACCNLRFKRGCFNHLSKLFWIIDISHHVVDYKQKMVHHLTLMTEEIKMKIEGVPYEKRWMTFENIDKNKICILKIINGHLCQYFIININYASCLLIRNLHNFFNAYLETWKIYVTSL